MFQVVVAHSDDIDTEDAVEEVLEACDAELQGKKPAAGVVFCGTEYEHETVLKLINKHFPNLQLIGCTTDGEMSSSGGFTEDAIVLALYCSDTIQIRAGVGEGANADPQRAAQDAVAMATAGLNGKPKLALVLPDGLSSSAYEVLDGFNNALGAGVPVVGGMTADRVGGQRAPIPPISFMATGC